MKHIVNFSGGLCSFFAALRTIQKYGLENTILLFADVLIESEDLYQFLGVPITRISLEISPWELFRKEGLIGNNRFPICSVRLKREPLNAWMARHYELDSRQTNALFEEATVVLGFDWSENHRVKEMQDAHPGWRISAPMTEPPYWDKCRMIEEGENLGLKPPILYQLGFPHNNCGGACVKAGISHFVHLYKVIPAKFLEWETEEQTTMEALIKRDIEPLTILKDRRGGESKSLSLKQLRTRIQAGEQFPTDEWGGCGCAGAITQQAP